MTTLWRQLSEAYPDPVSVVSASHATLTVHAPPRRASPSRLPPPPRRAMPVLSRIRPDYPCPTLPRQADRPFTENPKENQWRR